jgi:hypothetical protein
MERTHNHSSLTLTRESTPPALRLSTDAMVQYQSEENVNARSVPGSRAGAGRAGQTLTAR